jgi:phosphate transport system substrate-binding protein
MKKNSQIAVTVLASIILFSILLSACQGQTASQETISVSGAFALYPMMVRWAEEYQKVNPSVIIDISAGGAGKGVADTLSGAADIGMVSRALTPEEIAQGAFEIDVTKDAVFPIISAENPVLDQLTKQGVSREKLTGIYLTGEIKTWGEIVDHLESTSEIHVYTRSDASGAAEEWAKFLGGNKQEELIGIGVYGDPGILDAVIKDPSGIGYNNLNYVFDSTSGQPVTGAVVLPIDLNANQQVDADELLNTKEKAVAAVASGKYPSPPARTLLLVTKGEPKSTVRSFIRWILEDGQQYVNQVGYVSLPEDLIQIELQKVR